MKKVFVEAEVKVLTFSTEDVITASPLKTDPIQVVGEKNPWIS